MSYQQKPRQPGPSPENSTHAPHMVSEPAPIRPQVPSPEGGAPKINPNDMMMKLMSNVPGGSARTPPLGSTSVPGVKTPMPSPFDLNAVGEQMQPFVAALQETLQARMGNADQSRFWRGFSEYPEAMAKMIARRLVTNRMESALGQETQGGSVSQWLDWLGKRR